MADEVHDFKHDTPPPRTPAPPTSPSSRAPLPPRSQSASRASPACVETRARHTFSVTDSDFTTLPSQRSRADGIDLSPRAPPSPAHDTSSPLQSQSAPGPEAARALTFSNVRVADSDKSSQDTTTSFPLAHLSVVSTSSSSQSRESPRSPDSLAPLTSQSPAAASRVALISSPATQQHRVATAHPQNHTALSSPLPQHPESQEFLEDLDSFLEVDAAQQAIFAEKQASTEAVQTALVEQVQNVLNASRASQSGHANPTQTSFTQSPRTPARLNDTNSPDTRAALQQSPIKPLPATTHASLYGTAGSYCPSPSAAEPRGTHFFAPGHGYRITTTANLAFVFSPPPLR